METRRGEDKKRGRQRVYALLVSPSPCLLLCLLAAFLRFSALTASSLWSDEGNTWALIQRSLAQIAIDSAADIHPPGYYWLLKLWSMLFGNSALAMRSFSAVAGVILVWLIYQIGLQLSNRKVATFAALLAAIHPFQIYYSQEARMYMLLALESAGLMWAMLALEGRSERQGDADHRSDETRRSTWAPAISYFLCAAAGLWTHYSFPIVLLAAGCYWLIGIGSRRFQHQTIVSSLAKSNLQSAIFSLFPLLNLLVMLAYLPWLPTAITRVFAWPGGGQPVSFLSGLTVIAKTLLVGPVSIRASLSSIVLVLALLLPLVALWRMRQVRQVWLLVFWWLLPIGLMVGAGLIRDAYLKFLLAASPAWCLLVAAALISDQPWSGLRWRSLGMLMLPMFGLLIIGLFDIQALRTYYNSPTARDNYQGVARYIAAMGDPTHDLVLLDAPGQADVWRYYDPALPLLALPQQRPPDETQTIQTLETATQDRRQIFALFWATDEADPNQIVERWLDTNAFKGLDHWQGNLRFVTYALPSQLECRSLTPKRSFGDAIELEQLCQSVAQQQVYAGSAAILGLRWRTTQPLATRYKVTLQLLDPRGQLIAQQDNEPGGGSLPTIDWPVSTTISDNHGLVVPLGVPPGSYRLIVALYDAASGQRLPTATGDFADLGTVKVSRPVKPIPVEIIPIQHRLNHRFPSGVILAGYDLYERSFAHDPTRSLQPGAVVHITLYWQAAAPLPADWQGDQLFTLTLGSQSVQSPLAGGSYPTANWQAGEFVRGEFEIPFDGTQQRPSLTVGENRLQLATLP
ncbi:MAG: glycosyltransferase family 39 protein [Caldilineaceae bacterium]